MLDSWGMAAMAHCENELGTAPRHLSLKLPGNRSNANDEPDLEALRRRVSYLNAVNLNFNISLQAGEENLSLNNLDELLEPSKDEIVRMDYNERHDQDRGEKLEKDLQRFLFGLELDRSQHRMDRMSLLGEDFYSSKGKECGVDREFPTGVYRGAIAEKNRVLPTEYVDLIAINRFGHLSVIELKIDDKNLESISQLLDYALFFRTYKEELVPVIKQRLGYAREIRVDPIMCYLVNNKFHPKFDDASKFYTNGNTGIGFKLVKLTLGYKEEIKGHDW
jgi:hypothetical protein